MDSQIASIDTFYKCLKTFNGSRFIETKLARWKNFLVINARECFKIMRQVQGSFKLELRAVVITKVSTTLPPSVSNLNVAELKGDIVRRLLLDKRTKLPAPAPEPVKTIKLKLCYLRWCPFHQIVQKLMQRLRDIIFEVRETPFGKYCYYPSREDLTRTKCTLLATQSTAHRPTSVVGKSFHFLILLKLAWTLELADRSILKPMGNCYKTSPLKLVYSLKPTFVVVDLSKTRVPLILRERDCQSLIMACENTLKKFLVFSEIMRVEIPLSYYDIIVATSYPTLTPFGDSDFLLLEDADSFLGLADDPECSSTISILL
ncbi:hypothetical protein Tco_0497353 [Tanacetum coccineum]